MGVFGKLLGFAVAVGAGYATVKIAQKYDENKKDELINGEIDEISRTSTKDNIKKAAFEVYSETAEKVKTKVVTSAESIGIDTKQVGDAFAKAGDAAFEVGKAVSHASVKVAEKVMKEAPVVLDNAKGAVNTAKDQVKDAVNNVASKIKKDNAQEVEYVETEEVTPEVAEEEIDEVNE